MFPFRLNYHICLNDGFSQARNIGTLADVQEDTIFIVVEGKI